MIDVHTYYNNFRGLNVFTRADGSHILDLYLGTDNCSRKVLLLLSDNQPDNLISTHIIDVVIGLRKDKRWALSFTLCDEEYFEMFILFCTDIIDASRTVSSKEAGTGFVCERYKKWQRLLSVARSDLLSFFQLKGLIGEMIFLRDYLIPHYNVVSAVNAWVGPQMADQDFVIGTTWFEVKTVSSGSETIMISSVEQLDCNNSGELVVIFADKTSKSNMNAITPNSVYYSLIDLMPDCELKFKFNHRLIEYGFYPRFEYDSDRYAFEVKRVQRFTVTTSFPCLRRGAVPASITNVKYSLSLAAISPYLKG